MTMAEIEKLAETDRDIARLLSYVTPEPNTGCYLWHGDYWTKKQPYGRIWWKGKPRRVTRIIMALSHGELDPLQLVCHKCDTPPCIRPEHLYLGTHKNNIQDALKRNRLSYATLSLEKARSIRSQYASGVSVDELAKMYSVDKTSIRLVIRNLSWKEPA